MSTPEDAEEKQRAALAQAIRRLSEQWPHEMELIAVRSKIAHARYAALLNAGFSRDDALTLCTRPIEL